MSGALERAADVAAVVSACGVVLVWMQIRIARQQERRSIVGRAAVLAFRARMKVEVLATTLFATIGTVGIRDISDDLRDTILLMPDREQERWRGVPDLLDLMLPELDLHRDFDEVGSGLIALAFHLRDLLVDNLGSPVDFGEVAAPERMLEHVAKARVRLHRKLRRVLGPDYRRPCSAKTS